MRPQALFLFVLKPAIAVLNGLGNLVLRLCGLQPGAGEESLAMVLKHDSVLDGQPPDSLAVIREPLVIHEGISIFRVLERFRTTPMRVAMVLNEYGALEGIVPRPICWQPWPVSPCRQSSGARLHDAQRRVPLQVLEWKVDSMSGRVDGDHMRIRPKHPLA